MEDSCGYRITPFYSASINSSPDGACSATQITIQDFKDSVAIVGDERTFHATVHF